MTAPLLLDNVMAYSAQLALLVFVVAIGARWLNPSQSRERLCIWQLTFLAACTLPVLVFRRGESPGLVSEFLGQLSATTQPVAAGPAAGMNLSRWVVWVVVAGIVVHLVRLVLGYLRIHHWCQRAERWSPELACAETLDVRVSDEVPGPVTVGVCRPVVLVPRRLLDLPGPVQTAVLEHEALHARRRNPLQVLVAEAWRACLWFHPAAWVLTSRTELAREMALDRETLERTRDRRAYAQALLAFGATTSAAGAAAFISRTQISQRIAAIGQEAPQMTRMRRFVGLAALVLASATATAAAVTYAPMPGVSQEPVRPGNGVQLPRVIHEVKPEYTADALQAKVQGSVYLDVVVEADGSVGEVTVSQSLDAVHGLDQAAVDAAEQWRFEPGRREDKAVPVQIEIEMRFKLK